MGDWFDLVVPGALFVSVAVQFLGPLYFPVAYVWFLFAYFLLVFVASCTHTYKFRLMSRTICANLVAANDTEAAELAEPPTRTHVFILPNYNEPLGLLQKTIGRLAAHRHAAAHYVVVLAMEASEEGNEAKSSALVREFRPAFRDIMVTVHPKNQPGEAPGKGSNVSHGAREAWAALERQGLRAEDLMVTVADADAHLPELYIASLERAAAAQADPLNAYYCPPIYFSRNCFQVPAAVRVTDIMWSLMVTQNLANGRGLLFPCSTYSLSMALARRVGWWDVDFGAIGEDMHMALKCFYKTDGQARGVPVPVPINLTSVQSAGYLENLVARYTQSKRHFYGLADVAYALRSASRDAGAASWAQLRDRYRLAVSVMEAHLLPVSSGWLVTFAIPLFILLQPELAASTDPSFALLWRATQLLSGAALLPLIGQAVLYEGYHRVVDQELLKKPRQESRLLRHVLDWFNLPISGLVFMTFASSMATVSKLMPAKGAALKYEGAEKDLIEA